MTPLQPSSWSVRALTSHALHVPKGQANVAARIYAYNRQAAEKTAARAPQTPLWPKPLVRPVNKKWRGWKRQRALDNKAG